MAIGDGSNNATAGTAQLPNLLDSYGANRPAWQVAGVDYHVGVPSGLALKDPATISMAGVTVNKTTHVVTVTGSNITLDGYDFSLAGGWAVVISGSNTTVTNSNFLVGSNGNAPILGTTASSNITVKNSTIDGNNSGAVGGLIEMRGSGTLTVDHSWLKNAGGDMIQMHTGGRAASAVIEYNLIQNAGMAPGAHGDYTEFIDGPYTATIMYNTTTQKGGATQGFMVEPDMGSSAGVITSGEIGNNTLTGSVNAFTAVTVADIVNTFSVHDNYFDPSQTIGGLAFGGVRGGPNDSTSKSVYVHNVNMVSGAVLQDSNAPTTPTSPTTPPATTPSAPVISSWSPDTGKTGDGVTNAKTLTLKGTAAANSTVKLYDGSTQIGTATTDSSGAWTYTTAALNDAKHVLTATATSSGKTSAASAAINVTVDTAAPTAPAVKTSTVNADKVLLSGTAEANSTVTVYDGTKAVGTATTNASGSWSVTTSALSAGSHSLAATAADAAGNVSVKSTAVSSVIGTTPTTPTQPGAPSIVSFSQDSGVAGDRVTNDKTLTLTGTAAANSTIKVLDGSTQVGTATTNSSGQWTLTTSVLKDGDHSLTATATNASGQTSTASTALAVKVDATAPTVPTLTVSSQSGASIASTTNVADFILKGTAEANSTVKVFDGAKQIGTATANGSGAWSLDIAPLSNGTHSFTATATDVAGNVSTASAAKSVSVTTPTTPTQPGAPTIASFSQDSGVAGDHVTNDKTLTLTGTAAANSTIKVLDGSTQVGTATTNSSGQWTLTTSVLKDGDHSLTATATNASGQASAASTALAVKVDATAPTAPTLNVYSQSGASIAATTSLGDFILKGTAEANSTVKVFDGTTQVGTATANGSGAWSLDIDPLSKGTHSFTATATDVAGNASTASTAKSVSVTAPAAPPASVELTSLYEMWNHATIKGTADPNSQVKLFDGKTAIGTVTADADGSWTFRTKSLSDTVHTFTAKEVDSSGNVLATSSGKAILGSDKGNVLTGTSGDDYLVGNGNADTFVFAPHFGNDVIKDFGATGRGHDTIQFSSNAFDSFASVLSHASQVGQDVVIAYGADTLTLKNVKLSSLDSHDFHFA